MKKLGKTMLAVIMLAGTWIVAPAVTPAAQAQQGAITCRAMAFGVKTPTTFGEASSGSGFFGAVQAPGGITLPSTMQCTGSISGVATVAGNYTWCPQSTDHNPATNPHPDDPTAFDCNGAPAQANADELLYPGDVPTNVHIVATATLTGEGVWQDPSGAPAPDCSVKLEGHAISPTKLDAVLDCGGDIYEGAVVAGFAPILGTAGDLFSHPDDPAQNPSLCAEPPFNGSPDCFRALVFEGNMSVAAI